MNITKTLRLSIVALSALLLANVGFASSWSPIRTSGAGTTGWQPLVCQHGTGWQSCEMPVNIALSASPASLVATYQTSTIQAVVTDYYGAAINGSTLKWTTTDGWLSAAQTTTNASGVASVTLTSSNKLGGTVITAETLEKDGNFSIWVPFIDQWAAYPSSYTGWADYGAVFTCSAWSPDAGTVASGTGFTQYASCWQQQLRYRQDLIRSVVTGNISNSGGAVAEFQNIPAGISQWAVGTLYIPPPPPPEPPPPTGPVCVYNAQNLISYLSTCRGAGTAVGTFLRKDGIKYPSSSYNFGSDPKGGFKFKIGGVIYYKGAELGGMDYGCAGGPEAAGLYAMCHD